ncbi:MAG: hypothetical protein ACREP1_01055 [Rhodanobacteraceae bacterium]
MSVNEKDDGEEDSPEISGEEPSLRVREQEVVATKGAPQQNAAKQAPSWSKAESSLAALVRSWGKPLELPKSAPGDPRLDYLVKKYWRHRE